MKKKILAIALAAVMVFGITACSGEATARDEGGATTEASASNKVKKDVYSGEQEIKIAYVAHDLSTPNNQAWLEGIQREIAPWSDHVTVQAFNGESSAETQVTIMTDIINQQYDAIILQCSDGTALADSVTQAEEAGIPVVTLNLDCTSVHSALVMAVDYDAGRMIADQIAEEIGGKGKVVIIEGVQGLTRTDNMERGFIETVEANYPDIEIIDKQSASFEKETAMTVMNSFLQNYDQIDAVFAINDAMADYDSMLYSQLLGVSYALDDNDRNRVHCCQDRSADDRLRIQLQRSFRDSSGHHGARYCHQGYSWKHF